MLSELRKIPLEGLLIKLGGEERKGKYWRTPVGHMSLSSDEPLKFYNHDVGKGGYGAIDLVQMVKGCDFKAAKEYLQGYKPGLAEEVVVIKAASIKPKTAIPITPSSSVAAKEQVRNYLVGVRNLDPVLVAELMATGKVFAVKNAGYVNVGFSFDGGIGCELRGASATSTYHNCNGTKMPFSVERGDADTVVFVESAIDALSYLTLQKSAAVKVVSTNGSCSFMLEALAKQELASGKKIVAGFDNDKAGEALSAKVLRLGGTRETPKEKDWNDDLKALSKDRER
jgi:hypothetical protein